MPKPELRRSAWALLVAVILPACNTDSTSLLPRPHPSGFAAAAARVDRGTMDQYFGGNYDCCQEGLTVYAAYADDRNGDVQIYFNRSDNSGVSWDAVDVRIDHVPPGSFASSPRMAHSGSHVYVIWTDNRTGHYDVWLNSSADGGRTWQAADTRLSIGIPVQDYDNAWIACSGSTVAVIWSEFGEAELYSNVSGDGGATWQAAAVRIDHAPSGVLRRDPHLCCSSAGVFVCWIDLRNGTDPDIYFNRTVDGGATWLASDVRLDTVSLGTAHFSYAPQIACSGASVYVAWEDYRSDYMIVCNRSTDAGLTWLSSDVQIDHAAAGTGRDTVRLGCDGDNVYVSWLEFPGSGNTIYFNRSADGGLTWLPTDIRLDSRGTAGGSAQEAILACEGPNVFLVWVDSRTPYGAYFNRSVDGGRTWLPHDLKANPTTAPFYIPRVTTGAGQACVMWIQDDVFPDRSIRSIRWIRD